MGTEQTSRDGADRGQIEIPEAILAYLTGEIERCWFAPSDEATAALNALPRALPEGEVVLLASGGGFGMYIEARIDRVGQRIVLECFSNNRMGGDDYYRVWDDGTIDGLPAEPGEESASLDEYCDFFDKAARARGFMQFTTNSREMNRALEGRG